MNNGIVIGEIKRWVKDSDHLEWHVTKITKDFPNKDDLGDNYVVITNKCVWTCDSEKLLMLCDLGFEWKNKEYRACYTGYSFDPSKKVGLEVTICILNRTTNEIKETTGSPKEIVEELYKHQLKWPALQVGSEVIYKAMI